MNFATFVFSINQVCHIINCQESITNINFTKTAHFHLKLKNYLINLFIKIISNSVYINGTN